jgi:hypothetical protein
MTLRIRIALPLVQVVVASALIAANFQRPDTLLSPSWNKPEIQICHGLNAPAALAIHLLREAAYRCVPNPHQVELVLDTIVYVALVWVTWFIVGVQIERRLRSPGTGKASLRGVTDLVAITIGTAIGVVGLLVRHQFGAVTSYSTLLSVPYFLWCAAIVTFYGHDLWLVSRG